MMNKLAALATLLAYASATYSGFNYGSTNTDGSAVTQDRFELLFRTAQGLPGTNGQFTAARLYTMIQAGTANGVISAIPAAINTNTYLLLGLWASAGQATIDNEIAALKTAISQYGTAFTSRIAGISVGSEDLYRTSVTGIANKSGVGADPATIVNYINQVRAAIAGTLASNAQITHVDTWNAWSNSSNSAVAQAVDFISMDAYPYFESSTANSIANGRQSLQNALDATQASAPGKPVWITETGWPVSGPTSGQAVASVANSKQYWDDVECTLKGTYNLFWYTLQDSYPNAPPPPSFGLIGSDLSSGPLFDLTCPASSSSSAVVSTTSSTVSSSGSAVSTSARTTTTSASATSPLPVVSTASTVAFSPSGSATNSEPTNIVGTASRSTLSVGSTSATSSASRSIATAGTPSSVSVSSVASVSSVLASASSAAQSAQSAISSASAIAATATGSAAGSVSSALASASSALSSATRVASSAASAATSKAPTASVSSYVPGNGAAVVAPGFMAVLAGVFAYAL